MEFIAWFRIIGDGSNNGEAYDGIGNFILLVVLNLWKNRILYLSIITSKTLSLKPIIVILLQFYQLSSSVYQIIFDRQWHTESDHQFSYWPFPNDYNYCLIWLVVWSKQFAINHFLYKWSKSVSKQEFLWSLLTR